MALGSYFGLPVLQDALSIAHSETKKEMRTLVSYEWTDEALDARVKEGTEIAFCADCIKKSLKKKREILTLFLRP